MVPREVTLAVLADELDIACKWTQETEWRLEFDDGLLVIYASRDHPAGCGPVLLEGMCDSYRALPPAWRFVDPVSRLPTPETTPSRGRVNGKSTILHSVGVICAHFSRTAYKEFHTGGPHSNWDLASWDTVTEGVQAHTISQMLAVIDRHLGHSPGWIAT